MLGGTETSYTYEAFGETWSSGIPSDNPYQSPAERTMARASITIAPGTTAPA